MHSPSPRQQILVTAMVGTYALVSNLSDYAYTLLYFSGKVLPSYPGGLLLGWVFAILQPWIAVMGWLARVFGWPYPNATLVSNLFCGLVSLFLLRAALLRLFRRLPLLWWPGITVLSLLTLLEVTCLVREAWLLTS